MYKFANKYLLVSVITFIIYLLSSNSILASNVLFSDDFNDGNALGWEEHNPWGTWTASGSAYIGTATYVMSPALPSYSLNGDQNWTSYQLDVDLIGTQGIDKQILFHVNKSQNRAYIFNFRSAYFSGGNDAILAKRSPLGSENATLLQAVNFVSIPNTSYHINIQVNNLSNSSVNIKIKINQENIIEYTDNSNPVLTGGIGLEVVPGGYLPNPSGLTTSTKYDNIFVRTLDTSLPVPDIKQYSAPWGNLEYDTAHIWSPGKDTISRYGCALTSATMLLQYYGYNVSPDNLNTWLINNHGYIRDGLVDWSAITRWVKLNHEINPLLPKLEYGRKTFDTTELDAELDAQRPALVKLVRPDGGTHFVVATGKETNDYDINDPATTQNLLSFYPNSQYSRIDTFTPSFTDLSYLYFYSTPNVGFTVTAPNGDPLTDGFTTEGPYIDQTDNSLSNMLSYKSFSLPKPPVGTYIIQLLGEGEYSAISRLYNLDAVLTEGSDTGTIHSPQIKTYLLTVGDTDTIEKVDFDFIKRKIETAFQNGKIYNKGVYNSLLVLLLNSEKLYSKGNTSTAMTLLDAMNIEKKSKAGLLDSDFAEELSQYIRYLKQSF